MSSSTSETDFSMTPFITKTNKQTRHKFSKEENEFFESWYKRFCQLPNEKHKHASVVAFKQRLEDEYVRHFKYTSDIDIHKRVHLIII